MPHSVYALGHSLWGPIRANSSLTKTGASRANAPVIARPEGPHAMRGALGGPRVLLRRLREVMAEPVSAQELLDKIGVLIAANMVAEVSSVYGLGFDSNLELYAPE